MVEINDLAREVVRQVAAYTAEVAAKVEDAKADVAKELKKEIAIDSPELTPKYSKGWRIKKKGNRLIVHNKTDYQLTHLLEHGHVKRNGGRTEPIPHIAPNAEIAIREFLNRVEGAIEP